MAGPNQMPNMDQFDAYFRRADLDQDGRISGAEAVAFFQGSNLPKQVLAQIWMHADQNRIGFLGRAEFYNALKLVTVAQSKRELTADIVKAALYGPASAKIPAPQINLALVPAPQSNSKAVTPVPQLSGAVPMASQGTAIRAPQSFSTQQNQIMRPPRPPPPSTALYSQQGVASQGMPGVGTTAAASPPSSSISTDWYGGKAGGPPVGVASQVPNRGVSPSATLDGLGMAASGLSPSTLPRPEATTGLMQPAAPRPNDPTMIANQDGPKDSRALALSGNGFVSDSAFGDVFSATSSQPKQDSLAPPSSAHSLSVSSAIVTASTGPQPTAKPSSLESLQSAVTQQPVSSQNQQVQSIVKQNQQASVQNSAAFPVGSGNSASGQSQLPWPRMTQSDVQKYSKVFMQVDTDRDDKITGEQARNLFLSWRLPREVLKQVWDLSDQDNDSMLSLREFCIALYLMERSREGRPLPTVLPSTVLSDINLLPATSQPTAIYGNASWRPTSGLQQEGMTCARSVIPAAGGRPPRPLMPQSDEAMQPHQQKPRVPVLEKHLVDQLSTEEQNSLNSKFQEATEADRKVVELEKEILDSKLKVEFYHAKMQELILYKSRCDNRLNEIIERASADKHEVDSLAKKYEEKYKQNGDVASRITIEEATFRDIQEKKMEIYQAIVKMEQDGRPDGIRVRADRIQVDLEEIVRALNERCKNYGLRAKPTSLVELPFGWQPGIQEGAADWNEDWDKFEDEGFAFVKELTLDVQNIIAPPRPKLPLVQNKASSANESVTAISSSNADIRSGKQPNTGERVLKDDLAPSQTEEGMARSPAESPSGRDAQESPSKKLQDSLSGKNNGGGGSPHVIETQSEQGGAESVLSGDRSYDDPGWGTFDSQYDSDAVWDFKDTDRERHGESSFFGPDDWGLNPIRTESTRTDKKSPFGFTDSVPTTPMYNAGGSPHVDNLFLRKSPFAFADSVPGTPMFSSANSPRRFGEGSEEHSFDSFSRFDSFNMHDGGLFTPRETPTRFDSFRSTRDSDYGHGLSTPRETLTRFDSIRSTGDFDYGHGLFPPRESLARFDSMHSTGDSDYSHGLFPPQDSFSRFDSMRSTRDSDYSHGFPSFDDADPFGSSEPFKTSLESQTPRKDSDNWRAF